MRACHKARKGGQMPELNFEIVGAEIAIFAAVPTLLFKLHISNTHPQERVQSIMLKAQVTSKKNWMISLP